MIFVYWGLLLVGQSLAKGQYIGPWLAVWLPNLVLGAAGMAGLWRQAAVVRRRRSMPPLVGRARRAGCANSRRRRSCRACPT